MPHFDDVKCILVRRELHGASALTGTRNEQLGSGCTVRRRTATQASRASTRHRHSKPTQKDTGLRIQERNWNGTSAFFGERRPCRPSQEYSKTTGSVSCLTKRQLRLVQPEWFYDRFGSFQPVARSQRCNFPYRTNFELNHL